MDILRLVTWLIYLATAFVFGKEQGILDAKVKDEIQSFANSYNEERNIGYSILEQLLHRSRRGTCGSPNPMCTTGCFDKNGCVCKENIKGSYSYYIHPCISTCGVPNPKCTTGCFDENGCVCHESIKGPYFYYIHPCKENNKICKLGEHEFFDYTKISPEHSASLPANPTCDIIRKGVSDEEMQQIIDIHNTYRAKVARGEESRSPEQGVPQPGGANIRELKWNNELAFIAQKWADQCKYQHEVSSSRRTPCSRPYGSAGQNIYISYKSWKSIDNKWPEAIRLWYDEVADSPVSIVDKFSNRATSEVIGHYTQLVWAETYEIGCGAVYYASDEKYEHGSTALYVCNYGPGGNTIGREMYKIGQAATECGKSGKSTKYPGLCATQPE